jgi:hypothetical protein
MFALLCFDSNIDASFGIVADVGLVNEQCNVYVSLNHYSSCMQRSIERELACHHNSDMAHKHTEHKSKINKRRNNSTANKTTIRVNRTHNSLVEYERLDA